MPKSKTRARSSSGSKKKSNPSFEDQLQRVIEQEGMTISVVSDVYQKLAKSKAKKKKGVSIKQEEVVDRIAPEDHVRSLDANLIQSIRRPWSQEAQEQRLKIRFGPHQPSAYVLSIEQAPEERVEEQEEAADMERLIPAWVAPFETPLSWETVLHEAQDLVIDHIDPYVFAEQFTAHDSEQAFKENYGLWSKIRAPFVKWEMAEKQKIKHVVQEVKEREEELITETEQAWHAPILVPRLQPMRVMLGFLGLLAVVSLPAGAVSLSRSFGSSIRDIKTNSQLALSSVQTAMVSHGADQSEALRQASDRFQAADKALSNVNVLALAAVQALPQTRELYKSTQALLTAGDRATQAGHLLSEGLNRAMEDPAPHPDQRLLTFLTYLDSASPLLTEALQNLEQVKTAHLPVEVRPQIETLKESLVTGQTSLDDFHAISHWMLGVIGHDRPRTYLLVFQNQTELRPTGGFMGSIAEIVVDRGEITKVTVPGGGPYDLRGQLLARVVPPKPLQLIVSRWEFQDANWFPDFSASAKKIRWFWSKSGQPTLDGVIAVNATLMQKLLIVTGPIEMPEYGKTITAENFLLETQKAVELEYDKKENKPKKFIGDLMPRMLDRLKQGSREDWIKYLGVLTQALETKEVQVYMHKPEEQAIVERFHWSGQLPPVTGDALALIESNIGGQKTDAVIQEDLVHEVQVANDGQLIDSVTLTRQHTGEKGQVFRGTNNVAYIRLYVPQGSELLEASGFSPPDPTLFKQPLPEDSVDQDLATLVQRERPSRVPEVTVTDEFNRTAFGGWVQLEPGATKTTRFRYRLPFTTQDLARAAALGDTEEALHRAAYTLLLSSQSGKTDRTITSRIVLPENWKQVWTNVPHATTTHFGFSGVWDRDRVVAGLFELPYGETHTP